MPETPEGAAWELFLEILRAEEKEGQNRSRSNRRPHRAEPDIATQVAHHGAGMPVIDWARLLRCTECGKRDADFVVTGERR